MRPPFKIMGMVMLFAIIASAAFAAGAVDDLHAAQTAINSELQDQINAHAAALADSNAAHAAAQEALEQKQQEALAALEAKAAAEDALAAANAALAVHEGAIDDELLDTVENAVLGMYETAAPAYLELVSRHGAEAAAALIADRLGVDASVVVPLLITPIESVPATALQEAAPVPEAPAEAEGDADTPEADEDASEDAEE